jgi:hypothetical protein
MKTAFLNMSTVHPSLPRIQQVLHRAGVSITDNPERADYMIEAVGTAYVHAPSSKRIIFCDHRRVETFVSGCTRVDIDTGIILNDRNQPTISFSEFWKNLPEPKPAAAY